MTDLKSAIARIADGERLDADAAREAFDVMMAGNATPSQIGGFLMALRVRGETVPEIVGAVRSMRARMVPVEAPADAIDIVGTGGDGAGTYNVSTCAAFLTAAAGVPVAKHGNRALSSKSGTADALTALGVNLELSPEGIAACVREAGLGFMFAPNHHSAMRHVGPSRVELGTRTIFNLLGPLANPASVKRQLLGVYAREWVEPLAEVLRDLGVERVWVVHGDGLDELTTTGSNTVAILEDGAIRTEEIDARDLGVDRVDLSALKGGDGVHNAAALRAVLTGERNAYRDISVLNAGAALVVAGRVATLGEGMEIAAGTIESGAALAVLEKLVSVSNIHAKADARR
ncbi:anthranilate phosphoribosyltransferase [Pararhizobium mangrovi]|uniref:Anthranilate phosphoribosyltransferase n=1 Tax=Pararhizobium mangrovi TaxID=2590452 RepID=A0A506UEZ8_9HYPH|nr:anthranilate phosphoribosyltransferase [Pararhizobium mangrovi]TPW31369.1 anthranilate phosphoribosyltransferase [Pararhizobium mangrovi]